MELTSVTPIDGPQSCAHYFDDGSRIGSRQLRIRMLRSERIGKVFADGVANEPRRLRDVVFEPATANDGIERV